MAGLKLASLELSGLVDKTRWRTLLAGFSHKTKVKESFMCFMDGLVLSCLCMSPISILNSTNWFCIWWELNKWWVRESLRERLSFLCQPLRTGLLVLPQIYKALSHLSLSFLSLCLQQPSPNTYRVFTPDLFKSLFREVFPNAPL